MAHYTTDYSQQVSYQPKRFASALEHIGERAMNPEILDLGELEVPGRTRTGNGNGTFAVKRLRDFFSTFQPQASNSKPLDKLKQNLYGSLGRSSSTTTRAKQSSSSDFITLPLGFSRVIKTRRSKYFPDFVGMSAPIIIPPAGGAAAAAATAPPPTETPAVAPAGTPAPQQPSATPAADANLSNKGGLALPAQPLPANTPPSTVAPIGAGKDTVVLDKATITADYTADELNRDLGIAQFLKKHKLDDPDVLTSLIATQAQQEATHKAQEAEKQRLAAEAAKMAADNTRRAINRKQVDRIKLLGSSLSPSLNELDEAGKAMYTHAVDKGEEEGISEEIFDKIVSYTVTAQKALNDHRSQEENLRNRHYAAVQRNSYVDDLSQRLEKQMGAQRSTGAAASSDAPSSAAPSSAGKGAAGASMASSTASSTTTSFTTTAGRMDAGDLKLSPSLIPETITRDFQTLVGRGFFNQLDPSTMSARIGMKINPTLHEAKFDSAERGVWH